VQAGFRMRKQGQKLLAGTMSALSLSLQPLLPFPRIRQGSADLCKLQVMQLGSAAQVRPCAIPTGLPQGTSHHYIIAGCNSPTYVQTQGHRSNTQTLHLHTYQHDMKLRIRQCQITSGPHRKHLPLICTTYCTKCPAWHFAL